MEARQRRDVDLSEFIKLDTATVRSRYPAILSLFRYRISNDKRNRDALCVGCRKVIVKSKVSRLIGHAKKCPVSDEKLVKQLEQNHRSIEAQKSGVKIEKKSKPEVKKAQKTYDDQIVDLIAVNFLPLDLVESRELINIYINVDSSYQLPSRERLNLLLFNRASTELSKSLNRLKDVDNYSLTIELTGHSNHMAIVITTQNGHSTLIDLVDVSSDANSSTNLAAKALDSIRNSKIPDQKFNAILSDDTIPYRLAKDIIFEDFNNMRMIEYRSFAHILNQMVGSITKSLMLKETFVNLHTLVNTVSNNKNIVLKLKEKGQSKVFHLSPTSKTSTSTCINWALETRNYLQKIPRSERYNSNVWEPILDNTNFWNDLEKCKSYFDKISITINEVSNSKLSDAFLSFLELGKFITEDSDLDTSLKDLFIEAYVTYFHQLDLNLLIAAYILDPNKKMLYMTNRATREAKEYITKVLNLMGHKDDVAKVAINEFKRYTGELSKANEIDDVYSWWSNGDTVILKMVAMRLIACQASSINTQRVTTALDKILSQESLNVSTITDMLTIRIAQLSTKKRDETLEAPILCEDVINSCVELTEESEHFYASTTYLDFRNLIEFKSSQANSD